MAGNNNGRLTNAIGESLSPAAIKLTVPTIRLKANTILQGHVAHLLKRPVGRPPNHVQRFHAGRAGSWDKKRRVVAKVEWYPGELYPRVGFIVTNLTRPPRRVVAVYNQRGPAEQHIKEGKNAIVWTRLSCRRFRNNEVRLHLHALAYNLANFMRTLALPGGGQALVADLVAAKAGEDWSQDRRPRPVRHVPDGRGCSAEELVRRNPAADSSTPGAASTSVRRSLMPMLQQTTGELCLADHKRRHQRAGVAAFTAIPTKSRRIPSRTALKIASAGDPNYRLLTNRGSSGECQLRSAYYDNLAAYDPRIASEFLGRTERSVLHLENLQQCRAFYAAQKLLGFGSDQAVHAVFLPMSDVSGRRRLSRSVNRLPAQIGVSAILRGLLASRQDEWIALNLRYLSLEHVAESFVRAFSPRNASE